MLLLMCREWSGDQFEMEPQLSAAFPIHTYPHAVVTPDGGLAVSAGKLLVSWGWRERDVPWLL